MEEEDHTEYRERDWSVPTEPGFSFSLKVESLRDEHPEVRKRLGSFESVLHRATRCKTEGRGEKRRRIEEQRVRRGALSYF